MSVTAIGRAPCGKPERYVQQLVSHWSHKMAATWDAGRAKFPFSESTHAVMDTSPEGVTISLTTATAEENEHMRGVIERHLDRFAFREAPLSYEWTQQ